MDDLHVGNFAALLHVIVRETQRQLILCVHERSLYEYLCLELGPTRESDSLITIELSRNMFADGSAIRFEKHVWKGDLVTFGATITG
jgi:DNA repair protein SbcC/Rad50